MLKKYGTLVLFIFLFSFGFEKTLLGFATGELSTKTNLLWLLATLLLSPFCITFLLLMHLLINALYASWSTFLACFASGFFICGIFSSFANDALQSLWSSVISEESMEDWNAALSGPFAEEAIKAVIALMVLRLLSAIQFRDYLIAGLGVGFGFQFIEDLLYIRPLSEEKQALSQIIPQAFSRLAGSLASHWAYSMIILVGIYMLTHAKTLLTQVQAQVNTQTQTQASPIEFNTKTADTRTINTHAADHEIPCKGAQTTAQQEEQRQKDSFETCHSSACEQLPSEEAKALLKIKRLKGAFFMVSPVVLHFLWNAPLFDTDNNYDPFSAVLSTITLLLCWFALQEVLRFTPHQKPRLLSTSR